MIGDVHDRMIDFHTKWSETINRDQSARNRAVINYGNTNILYGILKQKDTVKWYYHARIGQLLQNLELESRIFVLRPADMKVCLSQKDFVHFCSNFVQDAFHPLFECSFGSRFFPSGLLVCATDIPSNIQVTLFSKF